MARDLFRFYFTFKGRATRRDFNIRYALVWFIGLIAASLLDFFFAPNGDGDGPFSTAWTLIMFVPTLAVTCRRLHDLGYSGWWQLLVYSLSITLIGILAVILGVAVLTNPLVGGLGGLLAVLALLVFYLVFFVLLCAKRGTKGPNKYGPDPLEVNV